MIPAAVVVAAEDDRVDTTLLDPERMTTTSVMAELRASMVVNV